MCSRKVKQTFSTVIKEVVGTTTDPSKRLVVSTVFFIALYCNGSKSHFD